MSTDLQLGPEQMDAVREIGDIGAGNAAASLSQMMSSPVQMSIPTPEARATVLDRRGLGE